MRNKFLLVLNIFLFVHFYSNKIFAAEPTIRFTSLNYVADEVTSAGTSRKLEVTLSAPNTTIITVFVRTSGGTASLNTDYYYTDNKGANYVQLVWQVGDSKPKYCNYQIVDDSIDEAGGEQIKFELFNPIGATLESGLSNSQTWIYDDDFANAPKLKKALLHEMRYYISTPKGWTFGDNSPVVFAIDGAGRWYRGMDEAFRNARENCPFIVITPITLSNGNFDQYDVDALSEYYPQFIMNAAWSDKYNFDEQGLLAILNEVKQQYGTNSKFFISGHSGGGLLNYRMIFQHPDKIIAAAPACPNFYSSAVSSYSNAPERINLPVKVFQGAADPYLGILNSQWTNAMKTLDNHQYIAYSREILVAPAAHEPFAKEVMTYFCNIYKTTSISEIKEDAKFQIFPNPSAGDLSIIFNTKHDEMARINILDIHGRMVYHTTINNALSRIDLDLEDIDQGIYFIQVTLGNKNYLQKIILNKN